MSERHKGCLKNHRYEFSDSLFIKNSIMNKTALCIPLILFTLPVYAGKTSYNKPEYWRLIHSDPAQGKSIYGNTFVRSLSPGNSIIEIRYEKPKPIIPNETINGRSRIIGKDYVKTRFKFQIDCKNKEISYEESAFFDSKGKLSAYEILPVEELKWHKIKIGSIAEKFYRFTCEF